MGGFGSGGHNLRKRYLEQFRSLNAAYFQKHSILTDGWRGMIHWKNDSQDKPCISVEGGRNQVTLIYRARQDNAADWKNVRDTFPIVWSPRHLGGAQAYFGCLRCNARAKLLYLANLHFRCRKCHNLVHASSQEQPGNRATRKNQKLRAKLGAPQGLGDYVPRPKGMHETTFQHYLERIEEAECEINDDMIRILQRIQKTSVRLSINQKDFW
ncbi:hypothetical protein [Hirschia baltica]|uniref:Uncharacterized protein n=1 Tax=Hirschia baltica (strain ATCC 49814 / DSM 5838 / IFAM 1418) TaxID=582402 RepID=C6XJP0_HIRBI|nr:hypothetical protein [Hirschia baltica]ACT59335.1 conserved hypothetical protein [Hirschia baltica ATCC 49814]